MHHLASVRDHLQRLQAALEQLGEEYSATLVRNALAGTDDDVETFLVSTDLWGGAGSIADQAGVRLDREHRRVIERLLSELGEEQMRLGRVNERTGMWVSAFRDWE